ncbi:MAG: efflux RND transporter periplasmic adaptor subunit [Myxococcota bacterium]
MIAFLTTLLACGPVRDVLPGREEAEQEEGEAGHEEGEGGHGEHGNEVELNPAALARPDLGVEVAQPRPLASTATAPARVLLDPRREGRLSATTPGQVDRILVRPGDRVKAGQTLATVASPDLAEMVGAWLSASARVDAARSRRDRLAGLEAQGVSSRAQVSEAEAELTVALADAEAAEERLHVLGVRPEEVRLEKGEHFSSRFPVKSPIDGEVLKAEVSVGQAVAPGDPMFHVGDLDRVWLIADVYERDLAVVRAGSTVAFTVETYGDERFTGTVDHVGALLDPETRTAEVRVLVDNRDHRLKPNMFARAILPLDGADGAEGIAVPAEAVQEVEGHEAVFVEEAPGRYQARRVRTSPLASGDVHVLEGVTPGERVVTRGAFTLKSELAKGELGEGHAH